MSNEPRVFVMRESKETSLSVAAVLTGAGYHTERLDTAKHYLTMPPYDGPCCIVLDLFLPGPMDGLALQRHLASIGDNTPLVFFTAIGSIKLAVQSLKAGAINFLTDRSPEQELLKAVDEALARNAEDRHTRSHLLQLQRLFGSLTRREYQVIGQVVRGRLNKQIAADFDIAEKTVKVHRAHAVEKLGVGSVAELVTMACILNPAGHPELPPEPTGLVGDTAYPTHSLSSLPEPTSRRSSKPTLRELERMSSGELAFMP